MYTIFGMLISYLDMDFACDFQSYFTFRGLAFSAKHDRKKNLVLLNELAHSANELVHFNF